MLFWSVGKEKLPSAYQKGQQAEKIAAYFLQMQGYTLQARNYRFQKGEIDLIVRKKNLMVFVEVKARTHTRYGYPEEAVLPAKTQHVIHTAEAYIAEQNWKGNIRFDILAIQLGEKPAIAHFEDAFG